MRWRVALSKAKERQWSLRKLNRDERARAVTWCQCLRAQDPDGAPHPVQPGLSRAESSTQKTTVRRQVLNQALGLGDQRGPLGASGAGGSRELHRHQMGRLEARARPGEGGGEVLQTETETEIGQTNA